MEMDGDKDLDFNLIDFDSSLSTIEPPPTDPRVLNLIMEGLKGLELTCMISSPYNISLLILLVIAEGGHVSLEEADVGDRMLWTGDILDIENEFPSISSVHWEWEPSVNASDDDNDLQFAPSGSLFTPHRTPQKV
jgi:hypothetical protein